MPHSDELPGRVLALEHRVGRIESDIESEKGTRARINADLSQQIAKIHEHLKDQDRFQNRSLGALIVINVIIVPIVVAILLKLLLLPFDKLY